MLEIQNDVVLKSLFSLIGFFSFSTIVLIAYFAKKYVKRADEDHDRIDKLESEHMMFHRKHTNIAGNIKP